MKLVRYESGGRVATGVVRGDFVVSLEPFFGASEASRSLDALIAERSAELDEIEVFANRAEAAAGLGQVRLLAPLERPSKIVAIGANYARPGADASASPDSSPVLFFKPPSALCGPSDPIVLPPEAARVIGEVELAIVIGKAGDRVDPAAAFDHVFGLMVANDVTAPDILLGESHLNPLLLQQSRGKGFRSFCPIGPWIETGPAEALLPGMEFEQHVGDQLEIRGAAKEMLVDVPTLLADVSAAFGLAAGDIVLTGSPPPLGGTRTALTAGVTLYSSITGLGRLANPVTRL